MIPTAAAYGMHKARALAARVKIRFSGFARRFAAKLCFAGSPHKFACGYAAVLRPIVE